LTALFSWIIFCDSSVSAQKPVHIPLKKYQQRGYDIDLKNADDASIRILLIHANVQ